MGHDDSSWWAKQSSAINRVSFDGFISMYGDGTSNKSVKGKSEEVGIYMEAVNAEFMATMKHMVDGKPVPKVSSWE